MQGGAVRKKLYCVYILTNRANVVLYTGVTSGLKRRVYEHRGDQADSFTKRYRVHKLVYYEVFEDPRSAIAREKQIKAGSRRNKVGMITRFNRTWRDLYDEM